MHNAYACKLCNAFVIYVFQLVCDANEELLTLMHSGILPLLKNVEEMIEKILLTMHNEDFSSQDKNQLQVLHLCAFVGSVLVAHFTLATL